VLCRLAGTGVDHGDRREVGRDGGETPKERGLPHAAQADELEDAMTAVLDELAEGVELGAAADERSLTAFGQPRCRLIAPDALVLRRAQRLPRGLRSRDADRGARPTRSRWWRVTEPVVVAP